MRPVFPCLVNPSTSQASPLSSAADNANDEEVLEEVNDKEGQAITLHWSHHTDYEGAEI